MSNFGGISFGCFYFSGGYLVLKDGIIVFMLCGIDYFVDVVVV